MVDKRLAEAIERLVSDSVHYSHCACFETEECSQCGTHGLPCNCHAEDDLKYLLHEIGTVHEFLSPEDPKWNDPVNRNFHKIEGITCLCVPRVAIQHRPMVTEPDFDGEG